MLSILSTVLTFLALILIPCLFISRRLSVPLISFTNIRRLINVAASQCDEEEESGTSGKKEKQERLPNHVAIILDGNRRWAKKRGQSTEEGHEAGSRKVIKIAMDLFTLGTKTVSLFAFSTENWGRPEDEVKYLMSMFEKVLKSEIPYFQRHEVKVSVIGNRTNISESLLGSIREVEEGTMSYKDRHLIVAIDYSGRFDILQACKNIAKKAKNGLIQVEDIDENLIDKELMTSCSEFPNPDLLIRTSGEQRISNFYLWQSAYTELYFPNVLWPDFDKAEYLKTLTWYQQRERRFGRRV
ncbi:unnamed protein product [Eruca vesicaria subsp. sativa]|uniref:Alkyl transferase n=1 Tax=Eruca vesicaria subsp. sativa TaxID=29727 RepID=A0ABC8K6Y8_ERUVS|nr:unnamed protein product [Eruca vesicaria subsp. sativa]